MGCLSVFHHVFIEHLLYARCTRGAEDSVRYKTDKSDALVGRGVQMISK